MPARKLFFLTILLICVPVLVWARLQLLWYTESSRDLARFLDKTAVVEGVVSNDPERRESGLYTYVEVSSINGSPARGGVLAILPRESELFFNDYVSLRGLLEAPENFETDTGRIFDYSGYLRVRGISALMRHATLRESEEGEWSLRGVLFGVKHRFAGSLERLLPEPRASLMEGVLLGERRGLPDTLTDALIISGLIHVVVLSGYNIAVVSESALRFFALFFPRALALGAGATTIVLFALLSGGGAATVRACIMGVIAVLARYFNRPAAALRALLIAGAAMVLWNPLVLLYDPGFLLSMLATFGLITLSPFVEKNISLIPERGGLRSIAASTLAVQVYVLPALLYMSGIFSLVSFPANVVALPAIPIAMAFGFAAGALGMIHPVLGFLPALGADIVLRFVLGVAEIFAALPLSFFVVPTFSPVVLVALYVPLTAGAFFLYRREQPTEWKRNVAPSLSNSSF